MARKIEVSKIKGAAEDALSSAYGELQSLRDDVREVYDNAQDYPGLAATGRIGTMGETADALDAFVDEEVELPECVAGLIVEYPDRAARDTRSARRDWAVSVMEEVRDAVRDYAEDEDTGRDDADAASDAAEAIDDHLSQAEGLEFPGRNG